jgi:hypothetical protein
MVTWPRGIQRQGKAPDHTAWSSRQFLAVSAACCAMLALAGCMASGGVAPTLRYLRVEQEITSAIEQYNRNAPQIRIGDSKEAVLHALLQRPLRYGESSMDWFIRDVVTRSRKEPRFYLDKGILVQIYYFRSSWFQDGRVTDNEFTPYIFRDGVLTSIGWRVLGGPTSFSGSGSILLRNELY